MLAAVAVLLGLGVLNLAATGSGRATHQIVSVLIGVVVLAVVARLPARFVPALGWCCYGGSLVLLLMVELAGFAAGGARRWLAVGAISFQPSELAKLGLLVVLAVVLAAPLSWIRRLLLTVALLAPVAALTMLQPDLSTTLLLVALAAAMLVISRIPWPVLLVICGTFLLTVPLALGGLRDYQLARLQAFFDGSLSPEGPGWSVLQARIAVSSGGLTGLADDPRYPLFAAYLPARETDLALVSLAQAWGLVAAAGAVLAAAVLVWRLAWAARLPRTREGMLVAAGLAVLFGAETIASAGGNLGLLPVAGVPFPLLGFGGTSAVVHLAALGVVLGVSREGIGRRLWRGSRARFFRPRLVRVGAAGVAALLTVIASYAWYLQLSRGEDLREAAIQQMTRCIRIPAARGVITDRHGTPLAAPAEEDHVLAVPGVLREDAPGIARLAKALGRSPTDVRARLENAGRALSVRLAAVPRIAGTRIAALGVDGVVVLPAPRRSYPNGAVGPWLGYVGVGTPREAQRWPDLKLGEYVGRAGLERQYDSVLRGADGRQCVFVDPPGEPVRMAQRIEPVPGANLRLSIDLGLQRTLAEKLAAARRGSGGDVAAGVALNAKTGEVLAMASVPAYDNSIFGPPIDTDALRKAERAPGHPMLDHVTQVAAPPGSAFKIVVAAANMVHGGLDPDRVVPTGGSFTYGGHTFGNWRSFGPQNMRQAIAWSNNVYFYRLAVELGAESMIDVAARLGVGRPTGIDLPGESPGYLGTPRTVRERGLYWYGGSTVILGIGQGYVTATPLQVARWTAGITTGRLPTPRLGTAYATGDGTYQSLPIPASKALPFAGKLGPVRDGMREAATSGTAARLRQLPVQAGGKTGSAQDPGSPKGHPSSWFTAAAPLDDPAVVMTAYVRGGGTGAGTSGPVVVDTLQHFFDDQKRILGSLPTRPAIGG